MIILALVPIPDGGGTEEGSTLFRPFRGLNLNSVFHHLVDEVREDVDNTT